MKLWQQPPTISGGPLVRNTCSRCKAAGQIAAALVGICGLIQFGWFVAEQDAKQQGVRGEVIIRAQILTLYASQSLMDFCKRHDLSAIASRDELNRLIESQGLQESWYGITVRLYQANGQSRDSSGVGSATDPHFQYTLAVLQTLAGRPPRIANWDLDGARIVIIPRQLENEEPQLALGQMLMYPEGMEEDWTRPVAW